MTPKVLAAQTERNIKSVEDAARKAGEAIGYRFGDIDNCAAVKGDELVGLVESWAAEFRAYIKGCLADALWDENRHDGLGL
jgi:hypothetical protein